MGYFKTFENFEEEEHQEINEGLFDKLFSWMTKIGAMFKNPQTIQKSVEATIVSAGQGAMQNFDPKTVGVKETYFIMMGDGKDSKTNFSMSLTKLADLDDSGLFQITGTTNPEMLKSLTGSNAIEDLTKNNIMAIVSKQSFIKGKPITIKILKNIMPNGKDYVSNFLVTGIASGVQVEKTFAKNKSV